MALKEFLARFSKDKLETKQKFKQMEEDLALQNKLEDRQKSANERELEKFMTEEREARIKSKLESYRKKEKKDLWTHNSVFGAKTTMLDNNKNMMKSDMFSTIGGSSKRIKGKGMFFN